MRHHVKKMLARPRLWARALLVGVLLLGGQFTLLVGDWSGSLHAREASESAGHSSSPAQAPVRQVAHPRTQSNRYSGYVERRGDYRSAQGSSKQSSGQGRSGASGRSALSAARIGPDLAVALHASVDSMLVGGAVTYTLTVSNVTGADPIQAGSPVIVTDVISTGLGNINVTAPGGGWEINVSATTGPALLTANYIGPYPIAAGVVLPSITVGATADGTVTGIIDNAAAVLVPGDNNIANNSAISNISVASGTLLTATAVSTAPVPTGTATVSTGTATVPVSSVTPTAVILTGTATPPPVTPTVPAVTATPTPVLRVNNINTGTRNFAVGQTMGYILALSSLSSAGPVMKPGSIVVNDVIPGGLANISAVGDSWSITMSSTLGPAVVTATYRGPYPVRAGTVLPQIWLTGQLTAAAQPSFTTATLVSAPGAPNPSLTLSADTIFVSPAPALTATLPPAETATALPVITAPATETTAPTITATVTATMTATATMIPTVTGVAMTPIATPFLPPDLFIHKSSLQGNHLRDGQRVFYLLFAGNSYQAGPVVEPDSITVTDTIPLGLKHIQVKGTHWRVNLSDTTSPAIVSATYTGVYPVEAGMFLPTLTISGELTSGAVPSFTDTALVDTPADVNMNNNTATITTFVVETASSAGSSRDRQQQVNGHNVNADVRRNNKERKHR